MKQTLYIIGNGFDLYHGLDTQYKSFGLFFKHNDSSIYDLFLKYFFLPYDDISGDVINLEPNWASFEEALSDLDTETLLDDMKNYLPDYSSDDFRDRDRYAMQIEMEEFVDKMTVGLNEVFKEFILNIDYPISIEDKEIRIEANSLFLNFNYTNSIERYYHINPNHILYIHNKAESDESKIILGHGVNPKEFEPKEEIPPEGLSEEALEDWKQEIADKYDYSYDLGEKELHTYFVNSFKNTSQIINENNAFFEFHLGDIKKVIVLGHSLSNIDKPYFEKVIDSIPDKNIEWIVSYHSSEESITHLESLKSLGIKEKQIKLIRIDELKENN